MKKIFISKDYDGTATNVVLTETRDLAEAFFQGRGDIPHSVEEIDIGDVSEPHQPKVITLFTSYTISKHDIGYDSEQVVLKRGN